MDTMKESQIAMNTESVLDYLDSGTPDTKA